MDKIYLESKKLNFYTTIIIIVTVLTSVIGIISTFNFSTVIATEQLSEETLSILKTFGIGINLITMCIILWFYIYAFVITKKICNLEKLDVYASFLKEHANSMRLKYLGPISIVFLILNGLELVSIIINMLLIPTFIQSITIYSIINNIFALITFVLSILFFVSTKKLNDKIFIYIKEN